MSDINSPLGPEGQDPGETSSNQPDGPGAQPDKPGIFRKLHQIVTGKPFLHSDGAASSQFGELSQAGPPLQQHGLQGPKHTLTPGEEEPGGSGSKGQDQSKPEEQEIELDFTPDHSASSPQATSPDFSQDSWGQPEASSRGREKPDPVKATLSLLKKNYDPMTWCDQQGTGYITLTINDHQEHHLIGGQYFRTLLSKLHFKLREEIPNSSMLDQMIQYLEGQALHSDRVFKAYRRTAFQDGKIYVDLCNSAWEAVVIDADGYRVVQNPPARFIRGAGMQPLPQPERVEDAKALKRLEEILNIPDDDGVSFALILGYLLGCFNPQPIYPLLIVNGGQGSGKTTMSHRLGMLIDPHSVPTRSAPRNEEDLMISAENSYLLIFDNLSGIRAELSDALCRLSTGAGFRKRRLYKDKDEVLFYSRGPVIVNGIDDLATRNDLADRAIVLQLPTISETKRRTMREMDRFFQEHYPALLGALYRAVSVALKNRDSVCIPKKPRMADFAEWVVAAEPSLPIPEGLFLQAYEANRLGTAEGNIEGDPVASAIVCLLTKQDVWEGSIKDLVELLAKLGCSVERHVRNATDFWHKLKRASPALSKLGIEIEDTKHKDPITRRRIHRISRRS